MKCPFCEAWSDVLETRTRPDCSIRRRHRCANGHTFPSTQRIESRPELMKWRERQVVIAVKGGRTMTEVAAEFGLKCHSEVSRIMKRLEPGFNARSAGQIASRRRTLG